MNERHTVRTCTHSEVDTLVSMSIKTFRDTFDKFNTPENMILYINKTFTKKTIEREMNLIKNNDQITSLHGFHILDR